MRVSERLAHEPAPASQADVPRAVAPQVLFTSEIQPGSNVGFPTEPDEVEHVVKILTDGRKRMSDRQVKVVRDAFTQGAAAAKEAMNKARAAAGPAAS